MAEGGGQLIKKSLTKPNIPEEELVCRLMAYNYELGEFLIVDDKEGNKHVGFFGGVITQPFLQIALASTYRYFNKIRERPCLDHVHIIDAANIENVQASPAKRDEKLTKPNERI